MQLDSLWREALDTLDLRGAVLFVDDTAASALAWGVGLPALLSLGVRSVLRLGDRHDGLSAEHLCLPGSSACDVSGGDRAVVLCSRYLPESMEALRCSLCQPSFTFVLLQATVD